MRWKPIKIWDDSECWIIGGGHSIANEFGVPESVKPKFPHQYPEFGEYLKAIHAKKTIAVNNSMFLGDWIDVLFFGDKSWWTHHHFQIINFSGLITTCSPEFKNGFKHIKCIPKNKSKRDGMTLDAPLISWNHNSGFAAINLAYHLGAKRIILLGFDMNRCPNTNNIHWHAGHVEKGVNRGKENSKQPSPVFKRHVRGEKDIARDAKKAGIEIINASPGSRLTAFKKMKVRDLL